MNRFLCLFFTLFFSVNAYTQNSQACMNATWICSNYTFTTVIGGNGLTPNLNISNPNTNPQNINSGCSQSDAPGPSWLIFQVINNGNLGFSLGANNTPFPQVGYYDWNLWSYSSTACNQIFSYTLVPVACNWNGNAAGGTGLYPIPTGGDSSNFQPFIPVVAGQLFVLLFSNFSGVNSQVQFLSTGTASISCNFPTRIDDRAAANKINFYPNPANKSIHISTRSSSEAIQISITDLNGKELIRQPLLSSDFVAKFNIDLPDGIYILSVKNSWNEWSTHKLVVNND